MELSYAITSWYVWKNLNKNECKLLSLDFINKFNWHDVGKQLISL